MQLRALDVELSGRVPVSSQHFSVLDPGFQASYSVVLTSSPPHLTSSPGQKYTAALTRSTVDRLLPSISTLVLPRLCPARSVLVVPSIAFYTSSRPYPGGKGPRRLSDVGRTSAQTSDMQEMEHKDRGKRGAAIEATAMQRAK
ncbi:hypothetical protein E5D57_005097 [Metarhizium anisopliae]|nr:hypothetical protein E5D57_005097 [Metarhizium anisopliae]